jgi:hypothetical protein
MNEARARQVLEMNALLYGILGVLLVLSSWDGLVEALELPAPRPSLFSQVGGVGLLALAYLVFTGGRGQALRDVAIAAFVANVLAALLVAAWLLFRDLDEFGVDALGYALLTILTALLAGFAVLEAVLLARRRTP